MKELEVFYKEYYTQVFAFCVKLTRNIPDAEDLTEETFYRAITHAWQYRGECKMTSWLCSIAKNLFYDKKRREKTAEKIKKISPTPPPLHPNEKAEKAFFAALSLPEPYSNVLIMRALSGAEYADIARIYQKSESWARVTYMRARVKLLKIMENEDE